MFKLSVSIGNGKVFSSLAKTIHFAAVRNGLNKAGDYWHKKMLPGHFEPSAASKYNYEKRETGYIKRKRKKMGHTLPLVWTGRLKQEATKGKTRKQKTGPDSIDFIIRLPTSPSGADYVRYNKQLAPGQMLRELTATTPDEDKILGEVFVKNYIKKARRDLNKHKSEVKAKA